MKKLKKTKKTWKYIFFWLPHFFLSLKTVVITFIHCPYIFFIPGCDSNGFFSSFKARRKSQKFVAGNAPDQPDEPGDVNRLSKHVFIDKSLYFSNFNILRASTSLPYRWHIDWCTQNTKIFAESFKLNISKNHENKKI